MNLATLAWLTVRHHARSVAGVVAGAACATAVVVGALVLGESVRHSLRERALRRVGAVEAALRGGERVFSAELADRVARELGAGVTVAPVLALRGVASTVTGRARAGLVDVLGVDERFFALSPAGTGATPAPGRAWLSTALARHLHVRAGDTIVLRTERPSVLPRETTVARLEDVAVALRVRVAGLAGEERFGAFSLAARTGDPFVVHVSRAWLAEQVGWPDRANLVLAGPPSPKGDLARRAQAALRACWRLEDVGFEVRSLEGNLAELRSARVFLDDAVVEAVAERSPEMLGILTYFVSELRSGRRATPYSFVAAVGPLRAGAKPSDPRLAATAALAPRGDGLVANSWLAADLDLEPGARVSLRYPVLGPRLRLEDQKAELVVRRVVPLGGASADPGLTPDLPGISDKAHCRDWDPGVRIDLRRIRDADERYWERYGATPKAFVSLATGRRLWRNRFGSLTAVRGPRAALAAAVAELPRRLDPARVGLAFVDVRGPALATATPATDFGGLFAGLGLFLVAAALLLAVLLFLFHVEARARELGTLRAVGFRPATVRMLLLIEALAVAGLGAALGLPAGVLYTEAVLAALHTTWRDAVAGSEISLQVRAGTLALGGAIGVACATGAILLGVRRTIRRPVLELLGSRTGLGGATEGGPRTERARHRAVLLGAAGLVAAGVIALAGGGRHASAASQALAFFGAGAALLAAGLALCRAGLLGLGAHRRPLASLGELGLRNAGRRPARSLATIGLLAAGVFLVVSVQAFRLSPPEDPEDPASGTGGFTLLARSSLPVLRDLATPEGRDAYGLDEVVLEGVHFVPLRVAEGDDASCLNLGLPARPRLLGVDPAEFARRGSFRFVATAPPPDGGKASGWRLLDADYGEDVVPAIGDQASITWTMHRALGEDLETLDEAGRPFRVRIVGALADSILQGSLVISERRFVERFPSAGGYRMLLVQAPRAHAGEVAAELTDALADLGVEVAPTTARLRSLQAVQNTYLLVFQTLGGLGLLLGSLGLGVVVLRNVLERREELAMLHAIGLRVRDVRRLLWWEHGMLLALGIGCGLAAALVAILPALLGRGHPPALGAAAALVGLLVASGALWVTLASRRRVAVTEIRRPP